MSTTILIVEDDPQIRRVVEGYLHQAGYHVLSAADGLTGLSLAYEAKPTLLILDLMLPELDGLEVARRIRASSDAALSGLYIIMLTARVEETDRVVGLELGADDYVTKPFSPRELVARVRAVLRRLESPRGATMQVLTAGTLRLDPTYRTVTLDDALIDLTTIEFNLLHYLMLHPGRPFSRFDLLEITQPDASGEIAAYERTIDAHIKNIRHKLGGAGRHSRFIETIQRIGYRFVSQV